MDTFEIISKIYEMRDESIAQGITSRDAMVFAEQNVAENYHISYNSLRKLIGN
ncbi:MAG: hypothetical protein HF976_12430 [ANME-2 cluster archaeon]|nr:hypothetical protein [ANME-2 cluster archaeon]MCD4840999.1 hypothetical protein [Methanosarcinales archaeon]MBC2702183.1 hypothetical protein [ANME-2 cluster archaeon]MBC2708062.1 hypothetical protein [ANME-2 cluster archaeon]MBC2747505.1 hypothetical protein [ANME-2 cluster archaeon]